MGHTLSFIKSSSTCSVLAQNPVVNHAHVGDCFCLRFEFLKLPKQVIIGSVSASTGAAFEALSGTLFGKNQSNFPP